MTSLFLFNHYTLKKTKLMQFDNRHKLILEHKNEICDI